MASKQLDKTKIKELQPNYGLFQLYSPENAPFRFQAKSVAEAKGWQEATRIRLQEALGFQSLPESPLNPTMIEEVDKGDYIRQKWTIQTWQYAIMPYYLLIPKTVEPPFLAVIASHGHGYGVKDIVGLWEDGEERDTADGYHKDFGVALCRRGFLVAAPEISCFGERTTDFSDIGGFEDGQTCDYIAHIASYLGGTSLGLRIHDSRKLIDYLATRNDVNIELLTAMGISGGGMLTFFSAALDLRIKAAVISGYYCTFRDSILAMDHCECMFVPGLGQFGEMYDLIGLIAPRPLLIESGDHDTIFPRDAVLKSVSIARKNVYSVWNKEKVLKTDYFEGRHQISGEKAYDFLWENAHPSS